MKLFKTLLIGGVTLPTAIVPMTTMNSCGQSWGKLTPISIGSTLPSDSPYSKVDDLHNYLDADEKPMTYLQSNYTIKQSSGVSYAYSLPYKFTDDPEVEGGEWSAASAGWYNSSASALSSFAKDKYKTDGKKRTKTAANARNAVLAPNIDFVSAIASSINSYLDLSFQYQASQVSTKNIDKTDRDLGVAWGNRGGDDWVFEHGEKGTATDSQNSDFYEFVFALSNLIGARKSHALFRTSSINFNFNSLPIPSYIINAESGKRQLNSNFLKLIEGEDFTIGDDELTYYSNKSKKKYETIDDIKYWYHDYTYQFVPVIVEFKDISKTYLDPCTRNYSFLVNDYYSTNKEIFSSIGKRWQKAMNVLTGRSKSDCKPHYKTIKLSAQQHGTTIPLPEEIKDDRISELHGNDFIIFVNYGVRYYEVEDEEPHHEKDKANILGVSGFMPAYLLKFEQNMFKHVRDEESPYIFNSKKVSSVNKKLVNILKRTSKDGREAHASDMSLEAQKIVSLLGHLFVNEENEINTINFISKISIEEN